MNQKPNWNEPLHENIESLSADLFALPESGQTLQQQLLNKTSRVQRNRRLVRRAGHASSLILLFALGFLTAEMMPGANIPANDNKRAHITTQIAEQSESESSASNPAAAWAADIGPVDLPQSPEHLERQAKASRTIQRQDRLRKAGDLYLSERNDIESALRCYQEMLAILPENRRGDISLEDSWLLAELKRNSQERN